MLFWLLLALAAALAWRRFLRGYPAPSQRLASLAPREAAFLAAAAAATFPSGGKVARQEGDAGIVRYVDRWLGSLPAQPRRLMRLLFVALEHATLLFPAPGRGGRRRFSALAPEQRVAVLEGWARSPLAPRRLVFASLRAILTMGYFGDPAVMRALRLAPLAVDTPVCEADLLWPPIGKPSSAIRRRAADLTPPSSGEPLDGDGPLHPAYAEDRR
jgi:hypothetical protein